MKRERVKPEETGANFLVKICALRSTDLSFVQVTFPEDNFGRYNAHPYHTFIYQ